MRKNHPSTSEKREFSDKSSKKKRSYCSAARVINSSLSGIERIRTAKYSKIPQNPMKYQRKKSIASITEKPRRSE